MVQLIFGGLNINNTKDSKEKVGPSSICKQKVKGGGMTSLKVAGVVQGEKEKVFFTHFFNKVNCIIEKNLLQLFNFQIITF